MATAPASAWRAWDSPEGCISTQTGELAFLEVGKQANADEEWKNREYFRGELMEGPDAFEKQNLALFEADYRTHPKLTFSSTPYLA